MAEISKGVVSPTSSEQDYPQPAGTPIRVKWYRSTWFNALILGICNFLAPGIWGAMNSLGGGGQQSPWLVNAANALTFCLMVLTCALSGVFVKYLGIKWTLILGAAGYCPYAAGLYCNNRFGTGCFRVMGQILGGAINLGLNSDRNTAGSVSYTVFQIFIALQAAGPFAGLLLSHPSQVQRTDGVKVSCSIPRSQRIVNELAATGRVFISKPFLMIIPLIAQGVFAEAAFFTYAGIWFSVRARALGSFLAGIVALASGNALGAFLDNKKLSLKTRSRWSFVVIMTLQGAWWTWGAIVVTEFRRSEPVFDWVDQGFGRAFAWFIFQVLGFQLNYMYTYFVIGNLAENDEEVIRYAGLLRGTESAVQAVSYGLSSVKVMGQVGCIYINFGLWALALVPGWLIVREFGVDYGDKKLDREKRRLEAEESSSGEIRKDGAVSWAGCGLLPPWQVCHS
ncbi:hypothetical protein Q7P37_007678 [Cladosporium fusiforme]